MSWFNKKKEEEILQLVSDAYYKGECPICKIDINGTIHLADENPRFPDKKLEECTNCHAAVYIKKTVVCGSLKKYRRNKDELFGLELISQETC